MEDILKFYLAMKKNLEFKWKSIRQVGSLFHALGVFYLQTFLECIIITYLGRVPEDSTSNADFQDKHALLT